MSQTSPSDLPFRDTPRLYGRMTRILHWTIAVLILSQFVGMGVRLIFGRQPFVSYFVAPHQPVGTLLFFLIVVRVVWAIANRHRRPSHGTGVLGLAARLGHLCLYATMIVIPSVALFRAYGSDRSFALFGVEVFPAQQPPVEWMVNLAGALHGELAWVLLALIGGHVVMVGLHEGMWRDGTLAKMAGRR